MEIGVDICKISRMEAKSEHFIKRILTIDEQEEFKIAKDKAKYLAAHFAFKEAIYKATNDPHYLSYYFLHEESGKPYVFDHPDIKVSISYEDDLVIVFVVKE